MSSIDYEALSDCIPALEVQHEPDGRLVYSRTLPLPGTAIEAEERDGEAVVFLRHWNGGELPDRENARGRFPLDATEDIAECMRLAIEEAGQ